MSLRRTTRAVPQAPFGAPGGSAASGPSMVGPAGQPMAAPARRGKPSGKARGKSAGSSEWWNEVEEVPVAGIPDAERFEKRNRWMRRYLFSAAFLFPLLCLVLLVKMTNGSPAVTATAANPLAKYAQTRSLAVQAVETWLDQNPAPLPGGHVLDWLSAKTLTAAPVKQGTTTEAPDKVEVHTVSVADSAGNIYDTTVTVDTTDSGRTVISTPALVPAPPQTPAQGNNLWPTLTENATADDAVDSAIAAWAVAMSSGDPQKLATTIGDGANPVYLPLSGATLSSPRVVKTAGLVARAANAPNGTNPTSIVVDVSFGIEWANFPAPKNVTELPQVAYDLRVDYRDGSPVVTAWGGPGTGPMLKPYGNKVTLNTGSTRGTTGLSEPDPQATTSADEEDGAASGSAQSTPTTPAVALASQNTAASKHKAHKTHDATPTPSASTERATAGGASVTSPGTHAPAVVHAAPPAPSAPKTTTIRRPTATTQKAPAPKDTSSGGFSFNVKSSGGQSGKKGN